ncbi:hypothetical protein OEA41_010777 [Lepraria neglecta]|uniref:Reverse transcriptase domain-containing protein n=1 Tax=Lepraria neglecta TaxID=209136 RepID=A0AAE0DFV3_9LECA|nr:hypothetical protein OEA41_010777 [Lepraria neglecta]
METFLKAPLKFVHDGPNAQTQIRQCGVPIQHRLGDALGEAVLFCLDFAVNKSTEANLYRMHDDLWFWGSSDATVAAWETIEEFTGVMGLTLNHGKTGSVHISNSSDSSYLTVDSATLSKLPPGQVRWGFLSLDTTGNWAIDESQVEEHIPQCLGRAHLDMVILTFEKIQRKLFATGDMPGANVTSHLRSKLGERFGIQDIPDGFFYLPIELGVLGIRNPFIPLYLVYQDSSKEPMHLIDMTFEYEEEAYNKAKKAYEDGTSRSRFHPT